MTAGAVAEMVRSLALGGLTPVEAAYHSALRAEHRMDRADLRQRAGGRRYRRDARMRAPFDRAAEGAHGGADADL